MRIFISHASKDKVIILRFAEFLQTVSKQIEVFCTSEKGRLWKENKKGEKYQQGKFSTKDSKNWKSNQQKSWIVWAIDSRVGRTSQKAESDTKWGVIEDNWNKQ